jgi:hypothetical protein
MKQVKIKQIQVEYTDGRKIVIVPYIHEGKQGYGFEYFDKKRRMEEYEGSWNAQKIADWFREILSADYEKEFDRMQMEYSSS